MLKNIMEKLLTTHDLSLRWQCSDETVLNHIPKGLKAIPLGSKDYRYSMNDILNYEEHLKTTMDSYSKLNNGTNINRFKLAKKDYSFQLD